jgi:hypothetical protein
MKDQFTRAKSKDSIGIRVNQSEYPVTGGVSSLKPARRRSGDAPPTRYEEVVATYRHYRRHPPIRALLSLKDGFPRWRGGFASARGHPEQRDRE